MAVVIMAGGSGTRFWPISRKNKPKQYLKVFGKKTLLEETVDRIRPICEEEKIFIVVNRMHLEMTKKIFSGSKIHILDEPVGRNTAPCIGLAALHILKQCGDEPTIVLPADQYISDIEAFRDVLETAMRVAEDEGIVTIGINPDRPETGYGYIKKGQKHKAVKGHNVFEVEEFTEKPDIQTAVNYLQTKRYLWNAGIFVFSPIYILSEIQKKLPQLYTGLMEIEAVIDTDYYYEILEEYYEKFENISFDYGILEKKGVPIYTISGSFGWSDIGSWQSLYNLKSKDHDKDGNLKDGDAIFLDCKNTYISSTTNKFVATLGLENMLIVDTNDALLVCNLSKGQEIRKIIKALEEKKPQFL